MFSSARAALGACGFSPPSTPLRPSEGFLTVSTFLAELRPSSPLHGTVSSTSTWFDDWASPAGGGLAFVAGLVGIRLWYGNMLVILFLLVNGPCGPIERIGWS